MERKAKFKVGQVVKDMTERDDGTKGYVEKIERKEFDPYSPGADFWLYSFEFGGYAYQKYLRPLTKRERGESR